jgi:hypothetical protein
MRHLAFQGTLLGIQAKLSLQSKLFLQSITAEPLDADPRPDVLLIFWVIPIHRVACLHMVRLPRCRWPRCFHCLRLVLHRAHPAASSASSLRSRHRRWLWQDEHIQRHLLCTTCQRWSTTKLYPPTAPHPHPHAHVRARELSQSRHVTCQDFTPLTRNSSANNRQLHSASGASLSLSHATVWPKS